MNAPPDDERELVERVAKAICDESLFKAAAYPCAVKQARAAIAVVLEEAALTIEEFERDFDGPPWRTQLIAAIRALNPKDSVE
jgi:hypothetical protein